MDFEMHILSLLILFLLFFDSDLIAADSKLLDLDETEPQGHPNLPVPWRLMKRLRLPTAGSSIPPVSSSFSLALRFDVDAIAASQCLSLCLHDCFWHHSYAKYPPSRDRDGDGPGLPRGRRAIDFSFS